MSRHRNVRAMNIDEEYDGYYDSAYGHSVEEEFCISPRTEAQFLYNRDAQKHSMSAFLDASPDSQMDEYGGNEGGSRVRCDSVNERPNLSNTDRAKLQSCVEAMQNVVGDTISESILIKAATENHFDLEKALDSVLSGVGAFEKPKPPRSRNVNGTKKDSSSTIKPPNLETVEDEKEFACSDREISGRMVISNGEIRTPEECESMKNTPAVPEGERDCEKAIEKSGSSVDEEKGKNDEQSSILPAEQLSKLKIDANDKEVLEAYQKERGGNKPLINLVVIGHVDAGKSTLMGHLLYRLGCVGKKTMHKYEQDSKKLGKSSFMYAWVLDETSEERNRGITMDVAQSKFDTPHRSVTLLDAPGHKDFIPNMITGAAQADVAVLVLDSTRGEFETGFEAGGQTREHTMLIRSLGVSQLAVAVNKLDNVNWDQERYKEIVSKLSAFLKQAGFKESEVQFVPCSGLTGENLIKPPELPELKKWYSGPCLVDVIDCFKPPERPVSKPLRFCISDVFKGMGSGFCVSGRIEAGYVQNGDKVLVMPAAEQATVKGMTIDETTVQHSFAGDHVTLQLSGVDINNVTTGCVVCDIARPVKVSARFQARLVIFNITVPITKGFPVILHYQSMSEQAFVKKLISQLHRSTGQVVKKKPRCLTKNSSAVVEIEVMKPICLEVYKDFKELGRFMLRSSGSTIAAGLVTEIL